VRVHTLHLTTMGRTPLVAGSGRQLLQASFGGLVSLDFPLPPALLGVGDELVLAVESGSKAGCR